MSVTFIINPNQEVSKSESVKDRVIEYVTEYKIKSIDGKKYAGWYGSTETEYFSIVFVGGVVSISLAERQMKIGEDYCLPLIVSRLKSVAITNDNNKKLVVLGNYNYKHANKDLDRVSFKDVMKPLGWKFASKKVKVQYDLIESDFYEKSEEEILPPINIVI